jgi:hypothetical protein
MMHDKCLGRCDIEVDVLLSQCQKADDGQFLLF